MAFGWMTVVLVTDPSSSFTFTAGAGSSCYYRVPGRRRSVEGNCFPPFASSRSHCSPLASSSSRSSFWVSSGLPHPRMNNTASRSWSASDSSTLSGRRRADCLSCTGAPGDPPAAGGLVARSGVGAAGLPISRSSALVPKSGSRASPPRRRSATGGHLRCPGYEQLSNGGPVLAVACSRRAHTC